MLVWRLARAVEQVAQEDVGHLDRPLVDRRADAALQHQLQHLRVRWPDGGLELLDLLLNVLDGDLDGGEDDRLALLNEDARLDVREVMTRLEDGLALVLLVELPVRVPIARERRRVDESNCD